VIRALVVDDEPLARTGLRTWLAQEPDVTVVGEAGDGPAAIEAIQTLTPDLVFLDIRMPGMDGFEVIDRVATTHLPLVVFVTAHDEHAIQAFDVQALDYLLKPVSAARFAEAMRRARAALEREEGVAARAQLARVLDQRESGGDPGAGPTPVLHRFVVKDRGRYRLVRTEEVEWIEAAGNYAEIHTRGGVHLVRVTIAALESRLDRERFARIHRSTIVRIDRIREIVPEWHGDCQVILDSGATIKMSRSYRDRLLPTEKRS
jgi:two-component system, LytTR family, response regulator